MAVNRSISLNVIADIKAYQREMAKLPGFTEKQAAASARKMEKHFITAQVKAAKQSKASAQQAAGAWSKVGTAFAGAFTLAAVTGAVTAIAGMAQEVADLRNELTDTARISGVAADTLGGLRLAAKGSGLEFSKLQRGLKQYPKLLKDASTGTGRAAKAFSDFGIDVENSEGNLRSADDVMKETIARLQAMPDDTNRAAAAADLLGTSLGPNLLQAVGDAPLDAFIEQVTATGVAMDGAAQKAGDWQRDVAELGLIFEGFKATLVDTLTLGQLANFNAGLVFFGKLFSETFQAAGEHVRILVEQIQAAARLDMDELGRLGRELGRQFEKDMLIGDRAALAAAQFVRRSAAIKQASKAVHTHTEATEENERAIRNNTSAQKAAQREFDAYNKLIDIAISASDDQRDGIDKIIAARQKQLDQIDDLERASGDFETAQLARQETMERAARDSLREQGRLWKETFSQVETDADEMVEAITEALDPLIDELQEKLDDWKDAWRKVANELIGIMNSVFTFIADGMTMNTQAAIERAERWVDAEKAAAKEIEQIEQELAVRRGEASKELTNKQLRERRRMLRGEQRLADERAKKSAAVAVKAFKTEQDFARGQAFIQAAILTLQLSSSLAKGLGPFAIPTATALAGAALGVQLATINRQKAPTFHSGGIVDAGLRPQVQPGPDAVPILARPGEEVSTPGEAAGGRMQERVVNYYISDRLAQQVVERGETTGRGRERRRREMTAGALPGLVRVY